MDYPCAKFGDFSFSCFGLSYGQAEETHTHTHTDAAHRCTPATTVGVSSKICGTRYFVQKLNITHERRADE